jgi:glycosyltransferase involved in cell wall biosynthesis
VKVSVITVAKNAAEQIGLTIASVAAQTYPDIEHVFVDGASTDGTVEVISAAKSAVLLSEPDAGIYDAMQKGVSLASGDVLYFLNAGDVFADENVVEDVAAFFRLTGADAVFGNLLAGEASPSHDHPVYRPGKILDLGYFSNRGFFFDESIHHQTIFYRRHIFVRCGYLAEDPAANGEYHLNMCAFVREGFIAKHLPRTIARFALGGYSTSDFAVERARFETARDILRRQFFPSGPGTHRGTEYLLYPSSLKNRFRILVRHPRLRAPIDCVRRFRHGRSRVPRWH